MPLTDKTRREMASRANWQVANPTTPANYFHLLRRQQNRGYRKPLIVASTKALLRLPASFSNTEDFTEGTRFHRVFPERFPEDIAAPEDVKRIVMCRCVDRFGFFCLSMVVVVVLLLFCYAY